MSLKSAKLVETNKHELEIEVSAEAFEKALQDAYMKAKSKIVVPGFRKGKAPRKIVERYFGDGVFYEDAVNALYPSAVDEAVKEAELVLVARPEVEVTAVDRENGISIKATCYTKPEVEIKDYKGIEAEKVVDAVTDEQVEEELTKLKEKGIRILTVEDRAAQMGDEVVIDFEGFKDGVPFDGGKADDFTLLLGGGQFIPGFEEQIVGHSTGEEFDINVSFPEDYNVEELKGAPVVFKLKLHEIKAKEYPEVDDEYIKDTTEFESVDEFKADARKKLEESAQKNADQAFESKVFEHIIDSIVAEIPEVMYEHRIDEMLQEMEQRFQSQGLTMEMYLQYTGQTMDTMRQTYREQAEKQVKLRLALEKISELEAIEVTDEEVEAEVNRIAEQYQLTPEQVKSYAREENIRKDLAVGKAADMVKESAIVK